ncbi:SEC-C domain-containing protein [bacterium]|nr:SEC-C domain-containing protein [bacterium]
MSVIEQLSAISNSMTRLINFVSTDDVIKGDFEEYLKTVGAVNLPPEKMQSVVIPYIFERKLPDNKTVIGLFLETQSVKGEEKKIISSLSNAITSIFEIEKVNPNGFDMYSILNEKKYKIVSLVKMNNFRGVHAGQFAICRIFEYKDEYYLLEIENVMSSIMRDEIYKYAVAKIIERPEDAYLDNPDKIERIEAQIKDFNKKFIKFFGQDEVITNNHCADNLINLFNAYCEDNTEIDKEEIEKNIVPVEENKYFVVEDFQNTYDNFMEKSLSGFSVHNSTYDIGLIFDKKLGLFVIPFYETFNKIYEVEDYTKIEGYKECVVSFLENDKLPAAIIERVAKKHENFMERTNKILESDYNEKSLLEHYKIDSLNNKIYSSTSVLYSSKIFSKVMEAVTDKVENEDKQGIDYSNVGRNDPCPCGSGKKFKKCCLDRVMAQQLR